MFNIVLRDPTNGKQYAYIDSVIAFCIPEVLNDVASSWIRKKLGLPKIGAPYSVNVEKNKLLSISKAAWPNLRLNEVLQHEITFGTVTSGFNPSQPNYPQKSSFPAKLNLFRDRIFRPKYRELTSLGPKMTEHSKKPALPKKLPHAKMTQELFNQGVQLESEPESDDAPESDPDGMFSYK